MRYYHFYPTCPSCHEPHTTGLYRLQSVQNSYLCEACGCLFKKEVDIKASIGNDGQIDPSSLRSTWFEKAPLFWKVTPNSLEEAYIQWLPNAKPGSYIVTWPWKKARFIPMMVTEYLLSKPNGTIVVMGETTNNENGNWTVDPGANQAFSNLALLPEVNETSNTGPLMDIDLTRENLLETRNVIACRFEAAGRNAVEQWFPGTRSEVTRELIEGQKEMIKSIVFDSKERKICDTGSATVKMWRRDQRIGRLYYKKAWLSDVISNLGSVRLAKETFRNTTVNADYVPPATFNRGSVFFLPHPSSKLPASVVFGFLRSLEPDVLIINDCDFFFRVNPAYGGEETKELEKYLSSSNGAVTLMFSTTRDFRRNLGIHDSNGFAARIRTTTHTLDASLVLNQLGQQDRVGESDFANPLSSRWSEIKGEPATLDVKYKVVPELDLMDQLIMRLANRLTNPATRSALEKYLSEAELSPLHLRGNYAADPEVFSRDPDLTYDQFINALESDGVSGVELDELLAFIREQYKVDSDAQTNPLLECIINDAIEIIESKKDRVSVVVHGRDVKGTEALLKKTKLSTYIPDRLKVLKWSRLPVLQSRLGQAQRNTVIAVRQPYVSYPLSDSSNTFLFIGSTKNISRFRTVLDGRLSESLTRPVRLLDDSEDAPGLVIRLQTRVGVPKKEIDEISRELTEEIIMDFEPSKTSSYGGVAGSSMNLGPGDRAVLAIDGQGNGMFIPLGARPMVRVGNEIDEVVLSQSDGLAGARKGLTGKGIILDRQGLNLSLRPVFLKASIELGKDAPVRNGPYEWRGLEALHNAATRWNTLLEKTAEVIAQKKNISTKEADIELSEELVEANLSAKNPDYIVGWWRKWEPTVIDETNTLRSYDVEHPRCLDDMKKVFRVVSNLTPGVKNAGEECAEESYYASRLFQKIREASLKAKPGSLSSLRPLIQRIHAELRSRIENLEIFEVAAVQLVEILRELPGNKRFDVAEFARISSDGYYRTLEG